MPWVIPAHDRSDWTALRFIIGCKTATANERSVLKDRARPRLSGNVNPRTKWSAREAYALACPELAKADMRPFWRGSAFA
jgi:hypothetical protein